MRRTFLLVLALAAGSLAATAIAAEAIKLDLEKFKMKAPFEGGESLVKYDDGKLCFHTNGTGTITVKVPEDGDYVITVDASCDEAEKMKAKFTLKMGETKVSENFELKTVESKEYTFEVKLKKGDSVLSIEFTNDTYKENEYDRNLFVHGVSLKKK
jgi:Ca-dependent carbohydrate-binding module xylan-binding